LVEANLLTEHTAGRFGFHDLLRSYATEQAATADPAGERRVAVHRVLDHYLHTAHAAVLLQDPARQPLDLAATERGVTVPPLRDPDRALAWFAGNLPVLRAAVDLAAAEGFDGHVWMLAWTLT